MRYIVLEDDTVKGLIAQVNVYLSRGWRCLGGIAVVATDSMGDNSYWHFQAMEKDG